MKHPHPHLFGLLIVMIVALVAAFAFAAWYNAVQVKWEDQGMIDWTGPLVFTNPDSGYAWNLNFSIATAHHGDINFTTVNGQNKIGGSLPPPPYFCGCGPSEIKIGTLVGLVLHRGGNMDLVFAS